MKALKEINCNKPNGFDILAPIIYKECASELAGMLLVLFNKSLKGGKFPSCLKKSAISPIHKSDDRKLIDNYRSVSVAPSLSKIFETIMLKKWHNKIYGRITKFQHGFVKGRSTQTNLLTMVTDIADNFAMGLETHIIFTDFKKAFDRTNHKLLLSKFSLLGFDARAVKWL